MSTIKVSLIIPFFNAANYISACIQSVFNQSLDDIEIIFVNDGSTDAGVEILTNYSKNDQRIKIIHQLNQGVSAARNIGLANARGEWIAFADADDSMEPNMLQTLYNEVQATGAGMAVCNVLQVATNNSESVRLTLNNQLFECKSNPSGAVAQMMDFTFDYANWNKLYKAAIIQKHNIRFDEHIRIGEDLLFNLYYLHYIERIVCINQPLYRYKLHPASAMALSEDKRVEQYNLQFKAYQQFTGRLSLAIEWDVFRRAMARGFYNTLMPVILKNIQKQRLKKSASIAMLSQTIAGLDADLFYYPAQKKGLQGFKKWLLEHKYFYLFACLVGLKYFKS